MQNNSLLYSFSFTEETARISVNDLSNGLYESVVTLPITVWHIIEHQRQQFGTYHQGQLPITENQLGTQAMGHEVAVLVDTTILTLLGQNFRRTTSLATFNILSLEKKGKFLTLGSLARM